MRIPIRSSYVAVDESEWHIWSSFSRVRRCLPVSLSLNGHACKGIANNFTLPCCVSHSLLDRERQGSMYIYSTIVVVVVERD